ncbi:MAG: acyltransferase family protein [Alphaproteobacteria bacterium]|nr:acyltransferase family protein [Alphaproteobacteria bacterium]
MIRELVRQGLGQPTALATADLPDYADEGALQTFLDVLTPLRLWHRYRVEGMEHLPASGRTMLVAHHTLATYDGFLLGMEIYARTGRVTRALGDDKLFMFGRTERFWRGVGIVPASPEAGQELLEAENLVAVAPGGMRESLRPRTERYQHRWQRRRGFVRLALRTGTPMVISACPRADEIFEVYPSKLTALAYKRLKIPVPMVRGLGPTMIPRPVPLVHHVAPPLVPPPWDPEREDEQVAALHARACAVMDELLSRR